MAWHQSLFLHYRAITSEELQLSAVTQQVLRRGLSCVQKPRESEGLGRQDSSGHLTVHLLPSSTTQPLAATQTTLPGRPSPGTALLHPPADERSHTTVCFFRNLIAFHSYSRCVMQLRAIAVPKGASI